MRRWIPAVIPAVAAILLFAGSRAIRPRDFVPEIYRASLPLVPGAKLAGEFSPQETDKYDVNVSVSRCVPPEVLDGTISSKNFSFPVNWEVSHRTKAIARGSAHSPTRWYARDTVGHIIGQVNLERGLRYSIRAEVTEAVPSLQNCSPELVVTMEARSLEGRMVGMIPTFVLSVSAVFCTVVALIAVVLILRRGREAAV